MNYRRLELDIRQTNALEIAESIGYISLFPRGSQLFALDRHEEITPEGRHVEGVRGDYYKAMLWHRDAIKAWEDSGGWGESGYILGARPDVIVSRTADDAYEIQFNERVDEILVRSMDPDFVRKCL